jgi:hypothetical protein
VFEIRDNKASCKCLIYEIIIQVAGVLNTRQQYEFLGSEIRVLRKNLYGSLVKWANYVII